MHFKIAELNGGFFEKFNSLLREDDKHAGSQEQVKKQQKSVCQITQEEIEKGEHGFSVPVSKDITPLSSDSEDEIGKNAEDLSPPSVNIDELYCEVLYEILHKVGCDVASNSEQDALFAYVQEAFKISNGKHEYLMNVAKKRKSTRILVNVEVIEGRNLVSKDSNGLSDPFVTLYLLSDISHRYNTSVKFMTLNPVWEENIKISATENINDDALCLEVWDFDDVESVKERLKKISEIKGVKRIGKWMKEVVATVGPNENELIGKTIIPLNTIPARGLTKWYKLDMKGKNHNQGDLKVKLFFTKETNNESAVEQYRHLLRIVHLHEVEITKEPKDLWCGKYSSTGENLLLQHSAQSGLTPGELTVSQYWVYMCLHENQPLNLCLFTMLLEKLIDPLKEHTLSGEDIILFWNATKKLLHFCFRFIRKLRKKLSNKENSAENSTLNQLKDVLNILNYVNALEAPTDIDLFPFKMEASIGEKQNFTILQGLNDAVAYGATEWWEQILDNNQKKDNSVISRLQHLNEIVQLVISDLQKAITLYEAPFLEIINFSYVKSLFEFYETKICTLCETDVKDICKNLKVLREFDNKPESNDSVQEGTSVFKLYLTIQRFSTLGSEISSTKYDTYHIKTFHQWFHDGIATLLDVAIFNAFKLIEKAVQLDKLVHVDNFLKCSSSAIDTITIFYQIKLFWEQLNWPDIETCYSFVAKIMGDISGCCVFYADTMLAHVDGKVDDIKRKCEKNFMVTDEWCLAINNIDYVREKLDTFTNNFGIEQIIQKLSNLKSPVEAEKCEYTLKTIIADANDIASNKIFKLLEVIVEKMSPAMKSLLIEGAETTDQDRFDKLMAYVDNNLKTLHRELSEENFSRTLTIIWNMLSEILEEIIQSNLKTKRPPSFFYHLRQNLNLMLSAFRNANDDDECSSLKRVEKKLWLYGLETPNLIHQVHLDLANEYDVVKDSVFGDISLRAKFENDTLHIEIMNARNLIAMDWNGSCDPFVIVHLLPEHKFIGIEKPQTKAHEKTQFPLFDEKFTIKLTPEQKQMENGLILFSIKDKDFLRSEYVGEAILRFKDIPDTVESLSSIPQVHLPLSRPTNTTFTNDSVKALEHRLGEKSAKDFLKTFKQRMEN